MKYRDDIPLKLYCPICGEEMSADVHPEEWNIQDSDNWICLKNPKHHCVVFGREDIEEWME